ncbi:MAG TPA: shikimate dehydrogenase [Chitinophagaceae bacterium]
MRRFGLIGFPLSHSFSQKYFEEKFQREGITDCRYELYPIKSIYELSDLLLAYPDLLGLNVTIPYKQLVIRRLTSTIHLPMGLRACNCIRIDNKQLIGYNTDIIGFRRSFTELLQPHHKKALILGNGGAAAAVAYCLDQLGIDYNIVSRKLHDGSTLTYSDINENVIATHQVIINTTPVGMYPVIDEAPPLPYQAITPRHYLFDLLYNPAKTLFLKKGEDRGALIRNGHEMLVIQAEESWKIWNGEVS